MGKYDKDRFQKELAIRYCLARDFAPFLEVVVRSASDLSDSEEVLTDLDVVGVSSSSDGRLYRTVFDCKTKNKMSSVNRAFWAAGVCGYTRCDEAFVILKNKAVHNHRISALQIGVDLHDEASFQDLEKTADPAFPANDCYQASIDAWNGLFDCYASNQWSGHSYDLVRNLAPLSHAPWSTFRRVVAELRAVRGQIDPAKAAHIAIMFDILASSFVLWAGMGRDIRRFYEPSMNKAAFEKVFRYYIWGGKEAYEIRQQMRDKMSAGNGIPTNVELPAWDALLSFAGLIVSAPQCVFECAYFCRELALKNAVGANKTFDEHLAQRVNRSTRTRQFTVALSDYFVAAAGLPKDLAKLVEAAVFKL